MDFWDRNRKRVAVNNAEDAGGVADSIDVRMALIERVRSGEITLAQSQAELKKIKRNARKNGKTTRQKAWAQG